MKMKKQRNCDNKNSDRGVEGERVTPIVHTGERVTP